MLGVRVLPVAATLSVIVAAALAAATLPSWMLVLSNVLARLCVKSSAVYADSWCPRVDIG